MYYKILKLLDQNFWNKLYPQFPVDVKWNTAKYQTLSRFPCCFYVFTPSCLHKLQDSVMEWIYVLLLFFGSDHAACFGQLNLGGCSMSVLILGHKMSYIFTFALLHLCQHLEKNKQVAQGGWEMCKEASQYWEIKPQQLLPPESEWWKELRKLSGNYSVGWHSLWKKCSWLTQSIRKM